MLKFSTNLSLLFNEVPLLERFKVARQQGFQAVEVKRSAKVNSKDLAGLRAFGDDYPQAGLFFLYGGKERLKINGVQCVPCDAFLRALSPGMKF